MDETIRQIIRRRDKLSENEIDDMFADFREQFENGEDPEELLQEVFGLEPDYIFDKELAIWG